MTAPMTLEQAIEEARKRLPKRYLTQDGPCQIRPWSWWLWPTIPTAQESGWSGQDGIFLGTGSPNPDGWRETLTEVTS